MDQDTPSTNDTGSALPVVFTDFADYAPGSTAIIRASNFTVGSTIAFRVSHLLDPGPDGRYGTLDDGLDEETNAAGDGHDYWYITDGVLITLPGADGIVGTSDDIKIGDLDGVANGSILTTWYVNPDDSLGALFLLTATAIDTGGDAVAGTADDVATGRVATTYFADANPGPLQTYFVPIREQDIRTIFRDLEGPPSSGSDVSDGIISVISLTISRDGTLIYYDQGENGYDADIANPLDLFSAGNTDGTQIWGNGNPADGVAPGHPTDLFEAGDVVILKNVVPANPRNPSQILFDGGDKIGATTAVAVTRAYWPQTVEGSGGTVQAGAIEVVDTFLYGTEYRTPVGQDLPDSLDNQMFSYTALIVTASQDGTLVQIDRNENGSFADSGDVNVTINQGQSYVHRGTGDGNPSLFPNSGINAGVRILTSKPVQAHLVTGDIDANFETDSFTLTPLNQLGNSYYSPVTEPSSGAAQSGPVSYFVYNPGTSSITVNWRASGGTSGSFNVAANTTALITSAAFPANSAVHFYTGSSATSPNGPNFDILATFDSATSTTATSGNAFDWGYSLVREGALTTEAVVGWAQGSSDTNGNPVNNANGSPLWVTANANTTLYVDWDGNPANSANTAPNGKKYDLSYSVNLLQSVRLYDTVFNDEDQSGARLFTANGALIAVAYGEDPTPQGQVPGLSGNNAFGSTPSAPYLDVGTTVRPLPALNIEKYTNGQDADAPTGPVILAGGTATFTYDVSNNGGAPIKDVVVLDDGGPDQEFNPSPILNNGFNIGDTDSDNRLDPGEVWKFLATRTVTPGQYTNIATVSGKELNNSPVAPDADPSNHFGAVPGVDIEKSVSVDGGVTYVDADTVTGPLLLQSGAAPKFKFVVSNTGNIALTNLTLSDSDFDLNGGAPGTTITIPSLAVNGTFSTVFTATWQVGQHTDTGSIAGTFTDQPGTTVALGDNDDANYFGAAPAIDVEKLVSVDNGATFVDADGATGPLLLESGPDPIFKFVVKNTGNVALSNVTLSDSDFDLKRRIRHRDSYWESRRWRNVRDDLHCAVAGRAAYRHRHRYRQLHRFGW